MRCKEFGWVRKRLGVVTPVVVAPVLTPPSAAAVVGAVACRRAVERGRAEPGYGKCGDGHFGEPTACDWLMFGVRVIGRVHEISFLFLSVSSVSLGEKHRFVQATSQQVLPHR
jgi:hypothetical protein